MNHLRRYITKAAAIAAMIAAFGGVARASSPKSLEEILFSHKPPQHVFVESDGNKPIIEQQQYEKQEAEVTIDGIVTNVNRVTNVNPLGAPVPNSLAVLVQWPPQDNKVHYYGAITQQDGSFRIAKDSPHRYELSLCPGSNTPYAYRQLTANEPIPTGTWFLLAPEFISDRNNPNWQPPNFYSIMRQITLNQGINRLNLQYIEPFFDPDNIDPGTGRPIDGLGHMRYLTSFVTHLRRWLNQGPLDTFLNPSQISQEELNLVRSALRSVEQYEGQHFRFVEGEPETGIKLVYGAPDNHVEFVWLQTQEGLYYIKNATVFLALPLRRSTVNHEAVYHALTGTSTENWYPYDDEVIRELARRRLPIPPLPQDIGNAGIVGIRPYNAVQATVFRGLRYNTPLSGYFPQKLTSTTDTVLESILSNPNSCN